MDNFVFHNPTKIIFGQGQIAAIKNEIPKNARVLITYGGGSVLRNGVLAQVKSALSAYHVEEFSGIEPNPLYETLMKAVTIVREHHIDFLLAVGGGSVIDGTKFIAAASRLPQRNDPWHILSSVGECVHDALPIGCVLTLPATGSESNQGAVISRLSTGDKQHFMSQHVFPQFAVLDPQTTFTLPKKQIANGVVDAFVHTIEQYLTYPVDAKVQDRFAEGLLLTLIEEGPKALQHPEDYATRANIMWVATLALNGLIGVGVPQDWATHMLGHELTAMYGLDHAQTLAMLLPAVLEDQKMRKTNKLLQYAERVWGIHSGTSEQKMAQAIEQTRAFFTQMGMCTSLSEYGVDTSKLKDVLAKLEQHHMTELGEHGAIHLSDSERIYNAIR